MRVASLGLVISYGRLLLLLGAFLAIRLLQFPNSEVEEEGVLHYWSLIFILGMNHLIKNS